MDFPSSPENILETIQKFTGLVSGTGDPSCVFTLLVNGAIEHTKADAALVLITTQETLTAAGSIGLEEDLKQITFDVADLSTLQATYRARSYGRYPQIYPIPMIDSGDLFGFLILFYKHSEPVAKWPLSMAESMTQMAAAILKKDLQFKKMKKAYDELKASRELLSRSEKLSYIGQVTASIIHDLKNILAPLSLQAELVKRCANNNPKVNEYVEKMKTTVTRGIAIVERFRIFSKYSDADEIELANIENLLAEAIEISIPRVKSQHKDIQITLQASAIPDTLINANEFIAVLVNILANAIDASPTKSEIAVRSELLTDYYQIEIRDFGDGMSSEVLSHLFEPFYTTKGKSGTGLGLMGARNFAKKNRGDLKVTSEEHKGTTVILRLPLLIPQPPSISKPESIFR